MKRTRALAVLVPMALGLLPAPRLASQDWTRFRGPNGTGISEANGIPSRFSAEDCNWKVELPGTGHSQPVIWGERLFVTSAPPDGSARLLSCLSTADGSAIWQKSWESRPHRLHDRNSFASSTPLVDQDHVYIAMVHGAEAVLLALDHDGNEKWKRSLGPHHSRHGMGASPIAFEDLIVFPKDHLRRDDDPEKTSFLYALDRSTGHLRWKTRRKSRKVAYGTPFVYEGTKGRPEIILTSGATGIASVEARTGRPLWEADVFALRTVSSPVLASGLVFGTCGSGGGGNYLVAVGPGGRGDVTGTHELYRKKQSMPYVPTPVAHGDRLYLWSDKGIATCLKAATGEVVWQERVDGNYSGSPVWIDGRIFCISERGVVTVIRAADRFEILGRSPLGEPSRSTPAVSGGRMYLRTYRHLVSVGGRKVVAD